MCHMQTNIVERSITKEISYNLSENEFYNEATFKIAQSKKKRH